jgi:hypothetical protein
MQNQELLRKRKFEKNGETPRTALPEAIIFLQFDFPVQRLVGSLGGGFFS